MKPARPRIRKARGCRGCPCRTLSGQCLDTTIKNGRCGDWVWYMRGRKRLRRLYVIPQDPQTPRQLHWRGRFGAASKKYSSSLTQAQREARIAAEAKFRSRPRMAQSGPLTGQQYSIQKEYASNAAARAQSGEKAQKALQTQGFSLSTSGIHRSMSRVPPSHGRRNTGRANKKECGGKIGQCGRHKTRAASEVRHAQRVARAKRAHYRNIARAVRSPARLIRKEPIGRRPSITRLYITGSRLRPSRRPASRAVAVH